MSRRVNGGFAAVLLALVGGALLGGLPGCGRPAAQGSKDTRKGAAAKDEEPTDPVVDIGGTPIDLQEVHNLIAKAVKAEELTEADEKKIRDSLEALMARVAKASGREPTGLPLDWDTRKKLPVMAQVKQGMKIDHSLVVAGEVAEGAWDSIILCAGDVHILGSLRRCIVVAKSVRFMIAYDPCLIVAADGMLGNSTFKYKSGYSTFVAGNRIRMTYLEDAVCHVIRPEPPDDPNSVAGRAIFTTEGIRTTFLNARTDAGRGDKDCRFAPQKTPIVRAGTNNLIN